MPLHPIAEYFNDESNCVGNNLVDSTYKCILIDHIMSSISLHECFIYFNVKITFYTTWNLILNFKIIIGWMEWVYDPVPSAAATTKFVICQSKSSILSSV